MGCELGKPSVVSSNGKEVEEEDDQATFSETQIDTIRSTWPLLAGNMVRVGSEVFARIFRTSAAIREMFHSFSIYDVEDLQDVPLFQVHAEKFMQTLEALVEDLENPLEEARQELLALGALHATFEGFQSDFFQVYVKSLLEVWEAELGEEFITEVRTSWTHFFAFVVSVMEEGYELGLVEVKRKSEQERDVAADNPVVINGTHRST